MSPVPSPTHWKLPMLGLTARGTLALEELLLPSLDAGLWMAVSWRQLMKQMQEAISCRERQLPTRRWRDEWGGAVLMDGMRELEHNGLVSISGEDTDSFVFRPTSILAMLCN
ncbi:MAG: hypothetical protein KW802_00145 [Candidatus Doudnabacteria bacterium]|nr:hypothetical protein [Candidatus Doudnabacteria bacterium]